MQKITPVLLIACLLFIVSTVCADDIPQLEIHHLNVGQADSTFIKGTNGTTVLIDLGEENSGDDGNAQRVMDYVGSLGISHIDYVIATHFHSDHMGHPLYGGGVKEICENFSVGELLHRDYSNRGDYSTTFTEWVNLIGNGFCNAQLAHDNDVIDLGNGATLKFVSVDGADMRSGDLSGCYIPPSENDYSTVLLIDYGRYEEVIAGDLSGFHIPTQYGYRYTDQETPVAAMLPDVDVYRVNHHGSSNSSNETFVAQIRPEVSIISVGANNPYGHPWPEVVDRLDSYGDVYRTDVDGNVVVLTDGIRYTVNGIDYTAAQFNWRLDRDGDGYFLGVDPNDNDKYVRPSYNQSCNKTFQYCFKGFVLP